MIYHLSTPDEWAAAQRSGAYTSSSRDRSLEQEGFIHCSRADQIGGVLERYYQGAGPLLLLSVATELLTAPWQDDEIGPGVFYPHVYGPINLDAVVAITPLEPRPDGRYDVPTLG